MRKARLQPQSRRRWIAGLALLLALALWGRGGWLYAKAGLAQVLLARAWERTVEAGASIEAESAIEVGRTAEFVPWPWADTYPVARLEVPRLGVRRIVLAGSSGRTLAFGPGHVAGTALPGEAGHAAVGGHRDTHLAFLQRLRPGDELVVETRRGELRRYRVDHREVVDHRDTGVLVDLGERRLSLITCYPFDAVVPGGPLRYVVSAAEVIGPDGADSA
ncbi:MAG: class GN sortase [Acidobacteriota bacterium]|nr:class GN sortase [Acidobacteriota bacterium]